MCKIDVLIVCIPLYWCLPDDENLLLKHLGQFMLIEKFTIYTIYMCILVYINDYMHNSQNEY